MSYIKNPDGSQTMLIPEEKKAAAIAFMREGAEKSGAEIEAIVEEGHAALLAAIDGVSESEAMRKPAPDEWSILQTMDHVVTGKRLFATLSAALVNGQLPPGFGKAAEQPSAQDGVTLKRFETLADARAAACDAHASMLNVIRSTDGAALPETTFRHFMFGDLNCREWMVFQRIHDDNHRPQIEAIRATIGVAAD